MTTPGAPRPAEAGSFVHRFVPSSLGPRAATLLLLHGTGGDEEDLLPLGRRLAPGAGLLGVRGRVLEGGMARYFRRTAEGGFDQTNLRGEAADLAAFILDAAHTHGLDTARLFALGYSNGANMVASLLLLYPHLLRGAVLFRAMMPLETPPVADLSAVSVLLSQGARDPLTDRERAEGLAQAFARCRARVTVKWQQAGHGLTDADLVDGMEWLAAALVREPSD